MDNLDWLTSAIEHMEGEGMSPFTIVAWLESYEVPRLTAIEMYRKATNAWSDYKGGEEDA